MKKIKAVYPYLSFQEIEFEIQEDFLTLDDGEKADSIEWYAKEHNLPVPFKVEEGLQAGYATWKEEILNERSREDEPRSSVFTEKKEANRESKD